MTYSRIMLPDGSEVKIEQLTLYDGLNIMTSKGYSLWYRTPKQKSPLSKFKSFKSLNESLRWIKARKPIIEMASEEIILAVSEK